jgi:hypothetical protein
MPDTGAFDAGVESVSYIILIVAMQFFPQKRCNRLWLYRVEGYRTYSVNNSVSRERCLSHILPA